MIICVYKGYELGRIQSMIEEEENEMNEYLKKKVATIYWNGKVVRLCRTFSIHLSWIIYGRNDDEIYSSCNHCPRSNKTLSNDLC